MTTKHERWQDVAWTPRERDVIALIGRGRTNAEIAEKLGITFTTAKWHVSEVISKLGVTCREEVAEYWREQRGLPARWRGLRRAMAALPVMKLGFGGAGAAVFAVGAIVAGGWVAGGGPGRAFPAQEALPEALSTTSETATPTPIRAEDTTRADYPWLPDGCPLSSTEDPDGLLCDWRRYPDVVARTNGTDCDLAGQSFEDMVLLNIDLHGCTMDGMRLAGQLLGADLSDTRAQRIAFEPGAERASFFGAVHANFRGADLRNATFRNVLIHGTDFSGADLEGATFEGVLWANTICPDGTSSDDADDDGNTCLNNLAVAAEAGDLQP